MYHHMHSQHCHGPSLSNMATDELHIDSIVRRHQVYMILSGSLVLGEELSVEPEIVTNMINMLSLKKEDRIVGQVQQSFSCILW